MSHLISSTIKPLESKETAEQSHPIEQDIELTAPASNSEPASPEIQLSRQMSNTAKSITESPNNKQFQPILDPLHLDLSVGPSQALPTALPLVHDPSSSPVDRRPSMGSIAAFGPVTPREEASDPLLLRSRLVGEQDIRRRPSTKGKASEKVIKEFYDTQNHHIEYLLKPMYKHASDDEEAVESNALKVKIAIYGSIVANFVLAILQIYAAVSSLSLSLFATAADSVFDPFANLVLNYLHRKAAKVDPHTWPAGGSRFESIGNIVYAFLMGTVSVVLIVESIRNMASHKAGDENELHIPSLAAVGVAFLVKLLLALYCYPLRKYSSQVQVLFEDHRNDLFINGFGIFTSAAGAKIAWWLDPTGAMIISFAIIFSWSRTAYQQFRELAGVGAPPEFLRLITYNAMLHHEHIEKLDSVRAYHSGPNYIVEIDIVMNPNTSLWQSHDVSQDLQDRLEELPMVERCYVHVDHEVEHTIEHRKKK